jgi:hypothetical protein
MPTFTPPADDIVSPIYVGPGLGAQNDPFYPVDPLMHRLMRHYRQQTRGRNIFKMSDGTFLDSQVNGTPPNMIQPPTAPYVTVFDATSGKNVVTQTFQVPYVVRTYYGGVKNLITAAEAAALNAAGYTTGP